MKKIIVAGSRDFNDYSKLCAELNKINWEDGDEIVSGTARGADKLGERYAEEHNINIKKFPANWNVYGKRAGYLRNRDMGEYCTGGIIFWDGISKGSSMMIDILRNMGKNYTVVMY